VIWHQYLHVDKWAVPESNLYIQLGQTSVAYFFMISSFLFVSKLLNSQKEEFNWESFFISRLYRIYPLYLLSFFLILVIVMHLSVWEIQVDYDHYFRSILKWFSFTLFGYEHINNQELTSIINAGVVWSLAYEWFFYLSLPIISIIILKKRPPIVYVLLSVVGVFIFVKNNNLRLEHVLSFLGGAVAPILFKYSKKEIDYTKPIFSFVILCCVLLIPVFNSSSNIICKLLIIISFTLIALGNSVFGILNNKVLKLLGTISYSTYLLHGFVLFIVMYYFLGLEKVISYSNVEYSVLVCCIIPVVVLISIGTYYGVEKPFVKYSKKTKKKHNENNII